jgi:hypothetical protein
MRKRVVPTRRRKNPRPRNGELERLERGGLLPFERADELAELELRVGEVDRLVEQGFEVVVEISINEEEGGFDLVLEDEGKDEVSDLSNLASELGLEKRYDEGQHALDQSRGSNGTHALTQRALPLPPTSLSSALVVV